MAAQIHLAFRQHRSLQRKSQSNQTFIVIMKLSTAAFALLISSATAFSFQNKGSVVHRYDTSLNASKVARNPNFAKLAGGYLFPEIARRRNAYIEQNPDMASRIISLGIGDTTQPIPEHILSGLSGAVGKLGSKDTYSGYGAEQGMGALREKIAEKLYNGIIDPSEVFVSDGAKCDIMRLQSMFGFDVTSAVQDPSYPVYVDTSVMQGQTGNLQEATKQYEGIVYMPCTAENGFMPDIANLPRADIVYFCSPNNPTGVAANKEQLTELVNVCRERGSILVFDAAYAPFIREEGVPKSIFEIPGAKECAIEVNSFSKYAGFTGVRLGWTVIPHDLKWADGSKVHTDFNRVMTTTFNGASNIVQGGGLACLDDEGLAEIDSLINYYLENAQILRTTFEEMGYTVFGGINAPYIFIGLNGGSSWDQFNTFLEECQVVTIPGAGFGPGGEGYLRLSAFAPRDSIIEACKRFKENYESKK